MEWTGPQAALRADLARGAGYALTVWPLVLRSVGAPIGWLVWLAAVGIALLAIGFLGEWLAVGQSQFMLNQRQSAAFVVATLLVWGTAGATGELSTQGTAGCSSDYQPVLISATNLTVALASPPGELAGVPGVEDLEAKQPAEGMTAFTVPDEARFIRLRLDADIDLQVQERQPGRDWTPATGGGAEPVDGWQSYGRAEFSDYALRVVAEAPADRDGTMHIVALEFQDERDANDCIGSR